jgi:hypothetical protein
MSVTHLNPVPDPTDPTPTHDQRAIKALSSNEFAAVAAVASLVTVLALLGFANSFTAVTHAAEPSFGVMAFTVPIGIDLGILAFAGLDLVLARLDMRIRWLRLIPWAFTAITVYLNVVTETTGFGRVAHAVLPCLWIVAVEVGSLVIAKRAGLESGQHMDAIRASRWALAPWPTAKLWRRMVLWEERSYPTALVRERDRLLALADLKDTYGPIAWRWQAPRRTKVLYKLGELAPTPVVSDLPELPAAAPVPALPAPKQSTARTTRPRTSAAKRTTKTQTVKVPDVTALMPIGRKLAADLSEQGLELNRDRLAAGLRAAGETASNVKVGALLAALKTETDRLEGGEL